MSFQVGDQVIWTSQAGGHTATKIGKVVAVVPAEQWASNYIPFGGQIHGGVGSPRKHESYIVQVDRRLRSLYWPLVKKLKKTTEPTVAETVAPVVESPKVEEPANESVPQ